MGNAHNKGRMKKMQGHAKEGAGTFHSRDENDSAEEIVDQGSRHYHELKLKRQAFMEKIKDEIKPQKPNLDVKKEGDVEEERNEQTVHGISNGTLCQGISNLGSEAQVRNLHNNHALPEHAVSSDDGRGVNDASEFID